MTRVYILVEGQTEEAFINELLTSRYAENNLFLTPIIISTSPRYRGGMTRYAKIKGQIEKLCRQDAGAYVTTMFDLYALPNDFPGKLSPEYSRLASGRDKAMFLEAKLANDINLTNFIPNLLVYEFEALLFSQINSFNEWIDDDDALQPLRDICGTTKPEDINDDPQTAPSKRILSAMSNYQKTVHGPLIALDIGLDVIRSSCPHFDDWLKKIEAKGRS
jgi:Domain of unknown function (DUF4276)